MHYTNYAPSKSYKKTATHLYIFDVKRARSLVITAWLSNNQLAGNKEKHNAIICKILNFDN